jgi:hypothetical protein
MAGIPLPTRRTGTGSIKKEVIEIAEADVLYLLRTIATAEVANQIQLGNPPTNMLIDGKQGTDIQSAKYSVRVFFNSTRLMIAALKDCWNVLMGPARVKTGYSKRHFEVWIDDHPVGSQPSVVTEEMIAKPGTALRIVGPRVPHTRKYQWMVGGKGFTRTNRKTKAVTAMTLYEGVVRQVKRRYKTLTISEGWVNVPNLNTSGRTTVNRMPGIRIGGKKKGRLG